MTLAPLREAADSLVKASTPQPFSTSKTSNWVARAGGLPDYIQHVAHGILRSNPAVGESGAISRAIGIVKRWAAGGGKVDANTKAAAAKAVAEWEAKKAGNAAKSTESYVPTWADERMVERDAMARVVVFEQQLGVDGMIALLGAGLLEAAQAWQPTLKPALRASGESERHDVFDGVQHVGTVSCEPGYSPRVDPPRWRAKAVNGDRVGAHAMKSKQEALDALQAHLAEAPQRVLAMPGGQQWMAARPSSYGETSYRAFPSEAAARHSAGLPASATVPEINSTVDAVAEGLRFDLMTVSGMDVPPLRGVQEARRRDPFDLIAEGFATGELRNFRGEWEGGGGHHAQLTPRDVSGRSTFLRGEKSTADRRYEGGVARMSSVTRTRLTSVFSAKERAAPRTPQPHADIGKLYELGAKHQSTFEKILHTVEQRSGGRRQSTASEADFKRAQSDVRAHPEKPHVVIAALKGRARATDKVEKKYDGDARRLTDLVRGTVLVPHVDDLPAAIDHIRAALPKGWTIAEPNNRFVHGRRGDKVNTGDLLGYRDISLLLRAPDGFQAELQINTTHMWIAKEAGPGHGLYEQTRAVREAAKHEKRELTAAERGLLARSDRQARELYGGALTRSARARPSR